MCCGPFPPACPIDARHARVSVGRRPHLVRSRAGATASAHGLARTGPRPWIQIGVHAPLVRLGLIRQEATALPFPSAVFDERADRRAPTPDAASARRDRDRRHRRRIAGGGGLAEPRRPRGRGGPTLIGVIRSLANASRPSCVCRRRAGVRVECARRYDEKAQRPLRRGGRRELLGDTVRSLSDRDARIGAHRRIERRGLPRGGPPRRQREGPLVHGHRSPRPSAAVP